MPLWPVDTCVAIAMQLFALGQDTHILEMTEELTIYDVSNLFSLFQRRARISACSDKVLALQIFEEMQQEEGMEALADEGNCL